MRTGFSKTDTDDTNSKNNNQKPKKQGVFKVQKNNGHRKKYTFVVKNYGFPESITEDDIKNTLMQYSHTLQNIQSRSWNVYILKDKNTGKNRDMCLVNFYDEEIKNMVLNECLSCSIGINNVIVNIEDGHNN